MRGSILATIGISLGLAAVFLGAVQAQPAMWELRLCLWAAVVAAGGLLVARSRHR